MSFDFKWFTTVPGLFITGGVVLLIIALIILLVTNKKSKKEKAAIDANNVSVGSSLPEQANPQPVEPVQPAVGVDNMGINNQVEATPVAVEPVVNAMPEPMVTNPVMDVTPVAPVEATPVVDVTPTVEPVVNTMPEPVVTNPVMDVTPVAPVEATPVVDVTPTVEPVINAMPEPVVTSPVMDVTPVAPVETTPAIPSLATEPVIYGGASPVVGEINVNPEPTHQIYGGADPLQNTQTIPTVEVPQPVVSVPTVEPVMTTPLVPPVAPVAMPNEASQAAPTVTESAPVVQIQQ